MTPRAGSDAAAGRLGSAGYRTEGAPALSEPRAPAQRWLRCCRAKRLAVRRGDAWKERGHDGGQLNKLGVTGFEPSTECWDGITLVFAFSQAAGGPVFYPACASPATTSSERGPASPAFGSREHASACSGVNRSGRSGRARGRRTGRARRRRALSLIERGGGCGRPAATCGPSCRTSGSRQSVISTRWAGTPGNPSFRAADRLSTSLRGETRPAREGEARSPS
jgi:hypothetical protein